MREVLGSINLYTARWNAWHAGRAALCPLNRPLLSFVALLLPVCKVLTTGPHPHPHAGAPAHQNQNGISFRSNQLEILTIFCFLQRELKLTVLNDMFCFCSNAIVFLYRDVKCKSLNAQIIHQVEAPAGKLDILGYTAHEKNS